jgi:hypothetical protein
MLNTLFMLSMTVAAAAGIVSQSPHWLRILAVRLIARAEGLEAQRVTRSGAEAYWSHELKADTKHEAESEIKDRSVEHYR